MTVEEQLLEFEGRSNTAYPDALTKGAPWTIGIGHCGPEVKADTVWTDSQIDFAFQLDLGHAYTNCLDHFPWFSALNEPRQAVLIGMVFQMGLTGVLTFKNTLAAIRDEHYAHAAENMRQSLWAKQTPKRALRLARQMETGEWQ